MLTELNHSGYMNVYREYEYVKSNDLVDIDKEEMPILRLTQHYAYDYSDGEITIHAYERIPEINGNSIILGRGFDNNSYLFCTLVPIDMTENSFYPQNYRQRIRYIIKGYEEGSTYSEAVFSFDHKYKRG